MILRKKGVVFVHIPKTAGSSIENWLLGRQLRIGQDSDPELAWGWCRRRRRWMQHLTLTELIEMELLTEAEANEMFVFSVVRNPYSRAVSAYNFLREENFGVGSFSKLYNNEGVAWRPIMREGRPRYRAEHLRPQVDFLASAGTAKVDLVGRFEDLDSIIGAVGRLSGTPGIPGHEKRGRQRFAHYSQFLTPAERNLIADVYAADIAEFQYGFEVSGAPMDESSRAMRRLISAARDFPSSFLSAARREISLRLAGVV